jgi:hypothetical protein
MGYVHKSAYIDQFMARDSISLVHEVTSLLLFYFDNIASSSRYVELQQYKCKHDINCYSAELSM